MSLLEFSKVVLRSLFNKPATMMYPVIARKHIAKSRGSLEIKIEDCIYCGMCSRKCPTAALIVDRAQKTWEIDRLRCITCNFCVEVCPKKCLWLVEKYSASTTSAQAKEIFRGA